MQLLLPIDSENSTVVVIGRAGRGQRSLQGTLAVGGEVQPETAQQPTSRFKQGVASCPGYREVPVRHLDEIGLSCQQMRC